MKKGNFRKVLTVVMALVFLLGMANTASAAGWWKENPNDTVNDGANSRFNDLPANVSGASWDAYWSDVSGESARTSPHGSFVSTSNVCKTCHAVHGARQDSFRLLRNENRKDECNYCHWTASGASKYRLYAFADLGLTVRGEHTLGSDIVPDSKLTGLVDRGFKNSANQNALYCFSCHSVHGANTLEGSAAGGWESRILRADPGGLGGGYSAKEGLSAVNVQMLGYGNGSSITVTQDVTQDGGAANTETMDAVADRPTIRAAFCAGCHTKNFNWRKNKSTGMDFSVQKGSHPLNTDGTLEVGGGAGATGVQTVSWMNATWCGSCHAAKVEIGTTAYTADANAYAGGFGDNKDGTTNDPWNSPALAGKQYFAAAFPHQSESNKLLFDDVTGDSGIQSQTTVGQTSTNDAYRQQGSLDGVCLKCHVNGTTEGVGKSF